MVKEINLDKNVPLPSKRAQAQVYPFDKMEIGDSFFVDLETGRTVRNRASLMTRSDFRLTCRTVTENGIRGVRVWRIE